MNQEAISTEVDNQEIEDRNKDTLEEQQGEDSTQINDDEGQDTDQSPEEHGREFKKGEEVILVRVRFPGNSKSFPFLLGDRIFVYGQKVVAMSDRGMSVGYINSFPYKRPYHKEMGHLKTISREATADDLIEQRENIEREARAASLCRKLIKEHELDMVLTHVEYTQFGKKAVFYFNAPQRVDFRNLVKELVQELKVRIELRQISVRDRTAAIGAIGGCGRQTCCSSFLKNYGNVSIKMAKNQNLALIPAKINGVCGQIKCCIKYEDKVYTEKRKQLPREGSFIQTHNGDSGKVLRTYLLAGQFEMLTDKGLKKRYIAEQYHPTESKLPSDYAFPREFQHINDETSTLIGMGEEEAPVKTLSERDVQEQNLREAEMAAESREKTDSEKRAQSTPQRSSSRGQSSSRNTDTQDGSKGPSKKKRSQNNRRRRRPQNRNKQPE